MPHFSFEYSDNLEPRLAVGDLCHALHQAALETGMFELGALRVRAHPCATYVVADDLPENGFLHLTISIGAGRDAETKKQAGDHIWSALTSHLAPLFETPHFALTMEIREIDPNLSWKQNGIHPRIRAAQSAP